MAQLLYNYVSEKFTCLLFLSTFFESIPILSVGTLFLSIDLVGPFLVTCQVIDTFSGNRSILGCRSSPISWPLPLFRSVSTCLSPPVSMKLDDISMVKAGVSSSKSNASSGVCTFLPFCWILFSLITPFRVNWSSQLESLSVSGPS